MKHAVECRASALWLSPEFRDFAIRWLGFDPRDEDVMGATISISPIHGVTYTLEKAAVENAVKAGEGAQSR